MEEPATKAVMKRRRVRDQHITPRIGEVVELLDGRFGWLIVLSSVSLQHPEARGQAVFEGCLIPADEKAYYVTPLQVCEMSRSRRSRVFVYFAETDKASQRWRAVDPPHGEYGEEE